MSKVADLVVKVGEYEKDGVKKAKWLNVGAVMKNDNGQYILLDRTFNPAGLPNPDGKQSCLISIFKKKEGEPEPAGTSPTAWEE